MTLTLTEASVAPMPKVDVRVTVLLAETSVTLTLFIELGASPLPTLAAPYVRTDRSIVVFAERNAGSSPARGVGLAGAGCG